MEFLVQTYYSELDGGLGRGGEAERVMWLRDLGNPILCRPGAEEEEGCLEKPQKVPLSSFLCLLRGSGMG